MAKKYLQIVNFDASQHYRDKNPIWIKLRLDILDDYEFAQVADETKFHAIGLMLLASRLNNKLPDDERWLRQKINAGSKINLKILLEIGFLQPLIEIKAENCGKNDAKVSNCDEHFDEKNIDFEKTRKIIAEGKQNLPETDENLSRKTGVFEVKSNKVKDESARAGFSPEKNRSSPEQNRREENRTKHNTTGERENAAVSCAAESFSQNKSPPHNSAFTVEECLRYVELCQSNGENIKNPRGLAMNLFNTGKSDSFIKAALFPESETETNFKKYGAPRKFTDEPCCVCFGAKMADTDGKGYRQCGNCRSEKGVPTGREPEES